MCGIDFQLANWILFVIMGMGRRCFLCVCPGWLMERELNLERGWKEGDKERKARQEI